MIWVSKQIPNNDPKFQKSEIFAGVGSLMRELFKILKIGFI